VALADHVAAEGVGRGWLFWKLALGVLPPRVPATGRAVTGTSGSGERQRDQDEQGQESDDRHDTADQIRPCMTQSLLS
jgi:hypothetical protein